MRLCLFQTEESFFEIVLPFNAQRFSEKLEILMLLWSLTNLVYQVQLSDID